MYSSGIIGLRTSLRSACSLSYMLINDHLPYLIFLKLNNLPNMTINAFNTPSNSLIDSLAGFLAGVASTIVAHPLDLIKTRLQGITR